MAWLIASETLYRHRRRYFEPGLRLVSLIRYFSRTHKDPGTKDDLVSWTLLSP